MPKIVARKVPGDAVSRLITNGLHPLLARACAARGIAGPQQLTQELERLAPPSCMLNVENMARLLADAIAAAKKLLIVADYDADGATACALGFRALRNFGAIVDFLVPNRFEYGYGLTPEIVRIAHDTRQPDILITVDNGIASVDGVEEANRLGLKVLVTDHHLPGDRLPDAWCIINPNQDGCQFPSKNLAGVGVMFYLMLALRAELRARGAFTRTDGPNLAELLSLVALGTVADVVKLDENNRILVQQGLKRLRSGRAPPGIAALFKISGRDLRRACAEDLGFALAPRLNAAGRLSDMSLGIECLTTDDPERAIDIAAQLDALNRTRRTIESEMQENALCSIERMEVGDGYTLSLFDAAWHQGVIGIVASRIKDRYHRPTIAFARGKDGEIKGSGRSIDGLHLRDALDWVSKRYPGLLVRFGGHAAAAGLTVRESDFGCFRSAFEEAARALLAPCDLDRLILTDGPLEVEHMTLDAAAALDGQVWGTGFPRPCFDDYFEVISQRVVGERHLKLRLGRPGINIDAILFRHDQPLPRFVRAIYRLAVNEYNGMRNLQLTLEHCFPAAEQDSRVI